MSGYRVRLDNDQLAQIAQMFLQSAENTRKTLNALKQRMDVLHGGDWIGAGAQAFYAEMNTVVLPGYGRLIQALTASAHVLQQIVKLSNETEATTAQILSRMPHATVLSGMALLGADAPSDLTAAQRGATAGAGMATLAAMFASGGSGGAAAAGAGAASGAASGASLATFGNYGVSSTAQTVSDAEWKRLWEANQQRFPANKRRRWPGNIKDKTPRGEIKTATDANGDVKVLSYRANMNVDSDGPTATVLSESENAAIRARHHLPNNVNADDLVARNQAANREIDSHGAGTLSDEQIGAIMVKHQLFRDMPAGMTDAEVRDASQHANQEIATKARADGKLFDWDKQEATSYKWKQGSTNSSLDPAEVPYIAVPYGLSKPGGGYAELGDLVLVRHGSDHVYAIVGDVGPARSAGEASMRTVKALGLGSNSRPGPVRGGTDEDAVDGQSVDYIILSGSGQTFNPNNAPKTFNEIQTAGEVAFRRAKADGLVD